MSSLLGGRGSIYYKKLMGSGVLLCLGKFMVISYYLLLMNRGKIYYLGWNSYGDFNDV